MKVILKSEVDNLGLPGDVVDVADGYGRNYLLPRGMAIKATAGAMKEATALTRSRKAAEVKTLGAAQSAKTVLESRTLRIPARVDERGSLYGSVGLHDVQRILKERGHDIARKRIELRGTIKEIGVYEIPIHVHPQVTAMVEIEVVDEEGKVTLEGVNAPDEPTDVDPSAASAPAADELDGGDEREPDADATPDDGEAVSVQRSPGDVDESSAV